MEIVWKNKSYDFTSFPVNERLTPETSSQILPAILGKSYKFLPELWRKKFFVAVLLPELRKWHGLIHSAYSLALGYLGKVPVMIG